MYTRLTRSSCSSNAGAPASGATRSVVVPDAESQQLIENRLFTEIEVGIIKDSTREELLAIARQTIDQDGVQGVILGCTELPLILTQDAYDGVPFLNTTAIHVESIAEYCRG